MTVATLRPNATLKASGAPTPGASTDHAVTSDDSDASYFTDDTITVDGVRLGFGTVTLPAGAITKYVRSRFRGLSVSGPTTTVACALLTGTTQIAANTESLSTTIANYTAPYVPVSLTQAEIDDLRLRWGYAQGVTLDYRVHEAYIDVVYVEQPVTVVTAVSPDPYTASSEVPIAWTNTLDSNGNAQTYYQLRVFDAATYGGVGFDPITSTPFWFEGPASSATSSTTGALPNGTYRAYVRVAQTVNGSRHWSAWAYDQFTVTVPDAEVSTVTMVADNTNALIQVTVARVALSEAWEYIELQRSTDGGTTWEYVRGGAYVDATGDANSFVIDDYEVANAQTVKYRARATRIVSGLLIVGPWVESAGTTSWSSNDIWLKNPDDPSANMVIKLWEFPGETLVARQGVFNVIGSPYPIIVSDVRAAPTGKLHVYVETIAEVAALRNLLAAPVLLVHATATKDFGFDYIAPGNAERVRVPRPIIRQERWVVDFHNVAAPADPNAGV